MPELPQVPLTLEGSSVLHQMFRFDWTAWRKLSSDERTTIAAEFSSLLARWEAGNSEGHPNQSALFSQIGHKGDLTLIHFRESLADLNRVELELAQTGLNAFLKPEHSYLSVVELGLYESSAKTYAALAEKGLTPESPEWKAGILVFFFERIHVDSDPPAGIRGDRNIAPRAGRMIKTADGI